ncbi:hypothetical protein JCM5350_000535 [Sporobolomyces pararoseus]
MDLTELSRDLPRSSSKISDFPPEIITKIFKAIPYWPSDNRRRTLASLCRVSSYFASLARPLLYNSLTVHIDVNDLRFMTFVAETVLPAKRCTVHVKSLRVTFEKEEFPEYQALRLILHSLKLDTLKIKASKPIPLFYTLLWPQPNLKRLILPDLLLDEKMMSSCFPLLPELEVFKGRIWVDERNGLEEPEQEEETSNDRPGPLSTPPTFKLRELYLAWGPRQDAFDYAVQSSYDTLSHLTLTMNDWRAAMNLSKLVALESLVFVANSTNVSMFGGDPQCLLALRECMKTVKTLPSLRTLTFEGTLQWTKFPTFAKDILSSLPESLEELSIGNWNYPFFDYELFRQQVPGLPRLRKLSLLETEGFENYPSFELHHDLLTQHRVQIVIQSGYTARTNRYLGNELDPFGTSSEVDSDMEEEEGEVEDDSQTSADEGDGNGLGNGEVRTFVL